MLTKQEESLAELKRLFFKKQLSFKTMLFVRETISENLEFKYKALIKKRRKKRHTKVIKMYPN